MCLELDNSKRGQFSACNKKYYYSYVRNLRNNKGSTALRYGITWHACMDAFYNSIKEKGWTTDGAALKAGLAAAKETWDKESLGQNFFNDYRTLENCIRSFISYIEHFNHDERMLKVVKTERPFKLSMKLQSIQEEKDFPLVAKKGLNFTGKIDVEILLNEIFWQGEHKTTGQALSIQKNRIQRSPQLIGYAYAGKRLNPDDPPGGSLIIFHYLSAYKSRKTGEYGEPKIQFERIPQIYTDGDLKSWRLSFLDTAERILSSQERNFWPVELDNCYVYGKCSYSPLCEQNVPLGEEITEGFHEVEPWEVAKGVEVTD